MLAEPAPSVPRGSEPKTVISRRFSVIRPSFDSSTLDGFAFAVYLFRNRSREAAKGEIRFEGLSPLVIVTGNTITGVGTVS